MPRLLGVDIPNDKSTVISLTYLYGVGNKTGRELCHKAGIEAGRKARDLAEDELGRLAALLDRSIGALDEGVSRELVRGVIAQRSFKSSEEIAEIERALEVSRDMHVEAMRRARPGMKERELAGFVDGLARSRGSRNAFQTIGEFSNTGITQDSCLCERSSR